MLSELFRKSPLKTEWNLPVFSDFCFKYPICKIDKYYILMKNQEIKYCNEISLKQKTLYKLGSAILIFRTVK